MENIDIITKAFDIAQKAHVNQNRKPMIGSNIVRPYISHPIQVSLILYNFGISDPVFHAAALLHDVLEDCDYTEETLLEAIGSREVVSIVVELTDPPNKGKEARIAKIERSRRLSLGARLVLGADMLANLIDIGDFPPWHKNIIMAYCLSNILLARSLDSNLNGEGNKKLMPLVKAVIAEAERLHSSYGNGR